MINYYMALKMNGTAIRLLRQVDRGVTDAAELRRNLGISGSQLNRLTRDLIGQQYLARSGGGLTAASNPKYALFSKIARRYDIQAILRDSNEAVLCSITEPMTVEEIQDATGLSLRTVQRALADFDAVGIVERSGSRIAIRREGEEAYLFARYLKESPAVEPGSEVIYRDLTRLLKRVARGGRTGGELTGFSLFSDYGIEYHTAHDFYVQQDAPLGIVDVLVHAIVSSAKDQSKNGTAMCALFYLRNRDRMDTIQIRHAAGAYSVSDVWLDIEGYVRGNPITNKNLFLPRDEFEEKARLYGIPPKLYTLPTAYLQLFEDIGSKLAMPIDVYLFGGENMRKKGIKPRTKDCDVVVTDEEHRREFVRTLEGLGYVSAGKPHFTQDDNRVDPFDILQHPARSRIDLFKTRIAGKLLLSEEMKSRSVRESFGRLNLYSLCNEDLFLLKAVTSREGDIQDMSLIVQAGDFDWKTVWNELIRQEHDTRTNFSSAVLDSVDYLHDQMGIMPPFYRRLIRHVLDGEIKGIIRDSQISLVDLIELLRGGDITEKMIRNRIDYLQRTGYLKKSSRNDRIFLNASIKTSLNVYSKVSVDLNARMKRYIKTYSEKLRLAPKTTELASEYVDMITGGVGGVGRKPSGLAAAILYIACRERKENVTGNLLATVSGLSQPSFGSLYRHAKILIQN